MTSTEAIVEGDEASDLIAALEQLLTENPGPVSIAAGVAALRAIGIEEPADELQSLVGTFAAERWRPILFDFQVGTIPSACMKRASGRMRIAQKPYRNHRMFSLCSGLF
ncbi:MULTISPECIES: hypothetical protein [unclassified Mesorhizobium]|uniref:hypothetical protein n=1 Tax=unclassified Mesorhizobium TaxID=325217 RepID=UPI00112B1E3B|nr:MULTISPECIES: hypothetical protein [unclassified Mesorhizobium]TPL05094.1 hypothetical protein FJ567_01905 [Mesorhizobium sp. B2-4-16]TPL74467.1 hypothetical protein FJ956_07390 [Mesorhizobium sp. B2-4-3]